MWIIGNFDYGNVFRSYIRFIDVVKNGLETLKWARKLVFE